MSTHALNFMLAAVVGLTFIGCDSFSNSEASLSQQTQMEQKGDPLVHKRPGNCNQQCQYQEELDIITCNRLYESSPVNLDDCLAKADVAYLQCTLPCPPIDLP